MTRPLTEIQRQAPEALLAGLRSDSPGASKEAGLKLVGQAASYGLGLRDFLTLAIDPRTGEHKERLGELSGYEAALAFLNLPVRDDFRNGIVLQAASETFQTFPGTRAMFPEVVDDMVKWKYRQDLLESITPLLGSSRTVSAPEMISTVVDDKADDYQQAQPVAEMSRVTVRSIRTTQQTVGIWKHGYGYRTSYEFARRAGIDLLVPYAARAERELEMSKVAAAVHMLVNGDGVQGASTVTAQSTWDSGATNGKISYKGLLAWLVSRAKAGVPVDTVVGNWDAYLQWLLMFAVPSTDKTATDADSLAKAGFQIRGVPILQGTINFAVASTMTANHLIGFSKSDTLEELVEANSLISESERSIINQTVTYVKTENTGYRLVFSDTRATYNYGG